MQLAIPQAPRRVRLSQIPGGLARVGLVAAAMLALVAGAGFAAARWARAVGREEGFLARAQEVDAQVRDLQMPRGEGEELARVDVLYELGGLQRVGTGLPLFVQDAQEIRWGSPLRILVDPANPDAPRELRLARSKAPGLRAQRIALWTLVGIFAAAACAVVVLAFRREVLPFRKGALVWLTPDKLLPWGGAFKASYLREDVRHAVRASVRAGKAPVLNGEKVLAAVAPGRGRRAKVIDEEMARAFGWWK